MQQVEQTTSEHAPRPSQSVNTPGLIGVILGVAGITGGLCFSPLALMSTLGLAFSIFGVFREPRGLAVVGILVGLAGTILGLILMLFVAAPGQPGQEFPAP